MKEKWDIQGLDKEMAFRISNLISPRLENKRKEVKVLVNIYYYFNILHIKKKNPGLGRFLIADKISQK
jgi:hypothetical protein